MHGWFAFDRLVLHLHVHCEILLQQDLNEKGGYYKSHPSKPVILTYLVDKSSKQLRTFKKGGGAQNPQHKLPLATKGFLPPCDQHPLGEPTLSLVVLAPGGYFVHKQVQPHPIFFRLYATSVMGATPSFGIYRLIRLPPLY